MDALEAERQRMARLLEETVIQGLDLTLAQINAYSLTLPASSGAQQALLVLEQLVRNTLQQARDLESRLHPQTLHSLGIEAALEALTNQARRLHGVQVRLNLRRLPQRLPPPIELALYRLAQDVLDYAVLSANRLSLTLYQHDVTLVLQITANGDHPTEPPLDFSAIERLGGQIHLDYARDLQMECRFTLAPTIQLTNREQEVLTLAAQGKTNREIADMLVVSPRTVKFHLDNVYSKLGVNSRTEAAVEALRHGWLHPDQTDSPQTD